MNESRTWANGGTNLTQAGSPPVHYELIDKDGNRVSLHYTAFDAAQEAGRRWPDQEQDPERTGKGWDIQIVGVE